MAPKRGTRTSEKAESPDEKEDTKPVRNEMVELDPQRVFYVPGKFPETKQSLLNECNQIELAVLIRA